jgi:hypothetical protein
MRAPKLSTRTKSLAVNTRVAAPRNKIPAQKGAGYGARKASAKDEIADGGGDNPFAKTPRQYRVSFGDTGLQADDVE